MLYEIENEGGRFLIKEKYLEKSASELGVQEKTIEDWLANHPELLFPKEQVLVFAQSVAGKHMADILALDSYGNLVIVEIKRDWSDRSTVAQLLEYAADCKDTPYETFNQWAQEYRKWAGGELLQKFREFTDRPGFPPEQLCAKQRVFIVAPDSDVGLKKIVNWLKAYGVPIEFIPFRLLADQNNTLRMIEITGVSADIEVDQPTDSWQGHWIFNTNETHAPGAYARMFKNGVIAIYGYENGGENLEGAAVGQKVFAYVNGCGLMALGEIVDPVVRLGKGIFLDKNGKQEPEEYHLPVDWRVVLSPETAISNSEASDMGYSLPVRTVFGRLHRGRLAHELEKKIRRRATSNNTSRQV
jgi:hypothetical protein